MQKGAEAGVQTVQHAFAHELVELIWIHAPNPCEHCSRRGPPAASALPR